MRRFALVAVVAVTAILPLRAQKPVPPPATPVPEAPSRLKSSQFKVVVTGCIQGRRLHASDLETPNSLFATLRASEFVLQGPRELMQQIRDHHDGHNDQVEGVVTLPPATNGASSTVTTKEFGKTRVTLGGREEGKAYTQDPPKPLTLKVSSLTHLKEGCTAAAIR